MKCEEVMRLLDPYLSGELDLTTCMLIEEHLAGCASCRAKLEEREEFVAKIQNETPRFTAPPALATRIRASLRADQPQAERGSTWHWLSSGWIYFGLGAALAMLALGLFFANSARSSQIAQEAISDHVRSLQVTHLMDVASTDQHTVKPWFAGKLDYSPQVIDLGPSGFPLVGGRLDVLDHRNVAAIIYQRRKHYINLFIWPADKSSLNNTSYELDGYHVLGWTKSGMNYLAVSELGEEELREFTAMIQDQIVPPME